MRLVLLCLVLVGLAWVCPAVSAGTDVVEQELALPVTIDGHDQQLETLVVRPAADGRYPIALIVNGAFSNPKASHAVGLAHLAHDFAHRGWLAAVVVWRGYGRSSSAVQNEAGTCTVPEVGRFLDSHAADLAAALASLHERPDVDPATAIGIGISIGGVSMLDLAARSGRPLTAVINISGGVWHDAKAFAPNPACGPFEDDLVHTVGALGGAAVPTLWLYALNDPWFQPPFVKRMAAAYRQGGGRVDLTMLPPIGTDGHTLYTWEANAWTQPVIDRFLRANGLPAMPDDQAFAQVLATLEPEDGRLLDYYLRMPTEKALALPAVGPGVYFAYAQRSIEVARDRALDRCRAFSRMACEVVVENMVPIGRWTGMPLRGEGR